MNTDAGKELGKKRVTYMENFIKELMSEIR
jgi:hypothetical protein